MPAAPAAPAAHPRPAAPGPPRRAAPAGQDDAATLEKLERFLDQRPYHDRVLVQLDETATILGQREGLRAKYAARLAQDPGDVAARVVLARLEARARRTQEALALLAELPHAGPELARLRGELHFARAEFAAAASELERAADDWGTSARGAELQALEGVLRTLARAHIALRDEPAAVAAMARLVALDPTSAELRRQVAQELADLGLVAPALALCEEAAELAVDDPARFVQILVLQGTLHERRGALREADASFARAMEQLGGGHWRRAELVARRKGLHTRLGTLGELAAELRVAAEREPAEPALRVQLADALAAAGARDEALQELARAAGAFPDSLAVGVAHAEALALAGEVLPAVMEYQRCAARHPNESRLHLAAGTLLATSGAFGAAKTQWRRELEARPESVELRLEIAALAASFGHRGHAEALLAEATRLAPGDLRPVRAAAALSGTTEPLEHAERMALAEGDADLLEELAFEWLEREDTARASRLAQEALRAGGDEARLLSTLVTIGLEDVSPGERAAMLLRHAELARQPAERVERVMRFAAAAQADGRVARALSEVQRIEDRRLCAAVEAHLQRAAGNARASAEALAELRSLDATGEEALRHAAALAVADGDHERAIDALTALADRVPGARIEALADLARVQRRAGMAGPAREVEDALIAAAPRNVGVLRDLAHRAAIAKEHQRAQDLYERAIALEPGHLATRYDLARVLVALGARDAALDELCQVLAADDAALRARARSFLTSRVLASERPEVAVELVRSRAERGGLTPQTGLLWWTLLREQHAERDAAEVLERLAAREPLQGALAESALAAYGASFTVLDASWAQRAVREQLAAATGDALRLAEGAMRAGDRRSAARALASLDATVASQVALVVGAPEVAVTILRRAVREQPLELDLLRRLAVAHAAAGEASRAAARLVDWIAALPEEASRARHVAYLELGELHATAHSRTGVRAAAVSLFSELESSRALLADEAASVRALPRHEERVAELLEFHLQHDLEHEFVRGALASPAEDLTMTRALLARPLRPSERRAAEERLATRPFRAWTDSEWDEARRAALREATPQRASWGRLAEPTPVNDGR